MKHRFPCGIAAAVLVLCGCGSDTKQAEESLHSDADAIVRKVVVAEMDDFINRNERMRRVRTGELTVCVFTDPELRFAQDRDVQTLARGWTGIRVEKKIGSAMKFGRIAKSKNGVLTCVIHVDIEDIVTEFKGVSGVKVGRIAAASPGRARDLALLLPDDRFDLALISAMQPTERENAVKMIPLRWDSVAGHWVEQREAVSSGEAHFAAMEILRLHEWDSFALDKKMRSRGLTVWNRGYFSNDDAETLRRWADGYVRVKGAWVKRAVLEQTEAVRSAMRNLSAGGMSPAQLRSVISASPLAENLAEALALLKTSEVKYTAKLVAESTAAGDIRRFFTAYTAAAHCDEPNDEAVAMFENHRAGVIRRFITNVAGYSVPEFARKYSELEREILTCGMNESEKNECLAAVRSGLTRLAAVYRREIAAFSAISTDRKVSRSLMEDFRNSAAASVLGPEYAENKDLFCIAVMFAYDYRYSSQLSRQASEDVRKRLRRAMPCEMCKGEGYVTCSSCHGTGQCKHCGGRGRRIVDDFNGGTRTVLCSAKCNICGGSGRKTCPYCGGDNFYVKGRGRVKLVDALYREISTLLQGRLSAVEKEIAAIDSGTVSAETAEKQTSAPANDSRPILRGRPRARRR